MTLKDHSSFLDKRCALLKKLCILLDKHCALLKKHCELLRHCALLEKHCTLLEKHCVLLEEEDGYVIRVLKHKNAHMDPANSCMLLDLYKNTQAYITFVRKELTGILSDDNDAVFVRWSGHARLTS